MELKYDIYGRTRPCHIFLSHVNKKILCCLNGVKSAKLTLKFNDISELKVEVDKYICNEAFLKVRKSAGYDEIGALMELFVPEFGWFRLEQDPDIQSEGESKETKSFTAYSYESKLQDYDLVNFSVNMGTNESLEMREDNINKDGEIINKIIIHNPDNPEYSLLDLALSDVPLGWTIGHVDATIAHKEHSFEIGSQDVYSFLRADVGRAARCVFIFNSFDMTINVYDIETAGRDTNLYLSYKNLLNSLEITPISNDIYTRFRVAGGEDLGIEMVNFGSSLITNIDFYLPRFPQETQNKYNAYKEAREALRDTYIDAQMRHSIISGQVTSLKDRNADDAAENNWDSTRYDLDKLKEILNEKQEKVELLEQSYTTESGSVDIPIESPDYPLYYSLKDVIIPDITAEITKRESGAEEPAKKVEYDTMWKLFGVNALELKKTSYQDIKSTLKDYSGDAAPDDMPVQAYKEKHQMYLDVVRYLKEIDEYLAVLQAKITELETKLTALSSELSEISQKASLKNPEYGFTYDEIADIEAYGNRTSDFKDESIIEEDMGLERTIKSQKDLLASAKKQLEIESRPQLSRRISSDNLFAIPEYKSLRNQLQVGDFMIANYGNENLKFRAIELDLDILDWKKSFDITFSDMTVTSSTRNDFETLLEKQLSSAKNTISKTASSTASSTVSQVVASLIRPYIQIINAKLENAEINNATIKDLTAVNGEFKTILTEYLKTGELEAAVAKIGHLDADSAFIKYLQATIVGIDKAEIGELLAKVAAIDSLLAGTISADLGHIIHLTAENVSIDDAVIKSLIAAKIAVGDLAAGDISTDSMRIISDDGGFVLAGNTMQFTDKNGNVRIQIGRDKTDNFTFVLYDEAGTGVLMDSTGIKESAIGEGLIKNDMLAGGITKDKFGFNVMETDENGNISGAQVIVDGKGIDVITSSITKTVETLDQKVEDSIAYRLDGFSSAGTIFKLVVDTTLSVIAFRGNKDITAELPESCFIWTRKSSSPEDDEYWNSQYGNGQKFLHVTDELLYNGEGYFTCSLWIDGTEVAKTNIFK